MKWLLLTFDSGVKVRVHTLRQYHPGEYIVTMGMIVKVEITEEGD